MNKTEKMIINKAVIEGYITDTPINRRILSKMQQQIPYLMNQNYKTEDTPLIKVFFDTLYRGHYRQASKIDYYK